MAIGVKDQTGWRKLIPPKKDSSPALAQFAFIFQKHEFLIWTISWNKSEVINSFRLKKFKFDEMNEGNSVCTC